MFTAVLFHESKDETQEINAKSFDEARDIVFSSRHDWVIGDSVAIIHESEVFPRWYKVLGVELDNDPS